MTRIEITEKLNEIFQDVFDDESLQISDELTSNDIEDWDSLRQISILSAVEDEFNIKMAISDTRNLKNIGALVDLIEARIA